MSTRQKSTLRPAVKSDQPQILELMKSGDRVHRHLDWKSPIEWIGVDPYFVLEESERITAALGCPPEPPSVAWIRLFANLGRQPAEESWHELWKKVEQVLCGRDGLLSAAIVLQDWFTDYLISSGFSSRQSIVMLECERVETRKPLLPPGITLRTMRVFDLPGVAEVDSAAFTPLWQNSLFSLQSAYPQAMIGTVAVLDDKIVGYQLSTRNPYGLHLARLAVHPSMQGRQIGYCLVMDLLQQAGHHDIFHVTVNTQSDNETSLRLYHRLGFHMTGDQYPVFTKKMADENLSDKVK